MLLRRRGRGPPAGRHRLDAAGYLEKELFIEGAADAYSKLGEWGSDGTWTAAPVAKATYKARLLVRHPSDPARFNGVVFVEWLNVSGQTEADPDFSTLHVELLREGYAYVGVGAQHAGIYGANGLKAQNAARYESLQHPGDSYSYDIFSQAGRAIRTAGDRSPLGELASRIRHVIAAGESQSAGRLVTYVNAIHPLVNVYDGFVIHSRGGGAAPLTQDRLNRPMLAVPSPARIRRDLKVPVFQIQAETDVPNFVGARQPDDRRVRTWELAGTAHADRYLLTGGGTRPLTGGVARPALLCDDSDPTLSVPINDGPMTYPMRAALRHMRRWVAGGAPPPSAAPLAVDGHQIRRDAATGLAMGGLRTPHVDVPVRTLSGDRGPAASAGFCRLFGRTDEWNGDADPWDGGPADPSPTPEPVVSKLYPTKSVYLARYNEALKKAIAGGYLLEDDRETIESEAAHVEWREHEARR